jgi:hypothetical protein
VMSNTVSRGIAETSVCETEIVDTVLTCGVSPCRSGPGVHGV